MRLAVTANNAVVGLLTPQKMQTSVRVTFMSFTFTDSKA